MGMRCVGVFAPGDGGASFVGEADIAVRLEQGYLEASAIIEAALSNGVDAIHPGYGFLSENAEFASAVVEAGLIWVGPSPEVIASMGDKIKAKAAAEKAGVPTLPSSEDLDEVAAIGYPILVKAAAGGGGKGMRIVTSASGLEDAVAGAKREALAAFGDDRVFFERYVEKSRHIEIQILGDNHGNLVHLGERECSIQRRHQKIIEESPSPVVDDGLRAAMTAAALSLAKSMNYSSTGTVEFLLEDETQQFYFLEVNTRLQVEHAVTEQVTGIDLVGEQLRVAAGEELSIGQGEITFTGHSIEARLYAEDAAAGFLPATGTLCTFSFDEQPGVRCDLGVASGSVVGVEFDPMLGKVIAHGKTRQVASLRLTRALEQMHIAGLTTNRDFLSAALRSAEFVAGDTTTDFIKRVDLAYEKSEDDLRRAATTAALWCQGINRVNDSLWSYVPSGWRNARLPAERMEFEGLTVVYRSLRDGSFELGRGRAVVHRWSETDIDIEIDGQRQTSLVTRSDNEIYVQLESGTVKLVIVPRFAPPTLEVAEGSLTAPMPGSVLEVRVAEGDQVVAGQILVVLEAMKMEHHITAPMDGAVCDLGVSVGQQLENGALLMTIEPADG